MKFQKQWKINQWKTEYSRKLLFSMWYYRRRVVEHWQYKKKNIRLINDHNTAMFKELLASIPLKQLINRCCSEGVCSKCTKIAKVISVDKKGEKKEATNFHSISILLFIIRCVIVYLPCANSSSSLTYYLNLMRWRHQ